MESTGTQCIGTNILLFNKDMYKTWGIHAKYYFTRFYNYNQMWDETRSYNGYEAWIYQTSEFKSKFNGTSSSGIPNTQLNTWYDYDVVYNNNLITTNFNSSIIVTSYNPVVYSGKVGIWGIHADNTKGESRVKFFKLVGDGVYLFNGIPCYRISDHAGGMWDTVTNTFFGNSGTGNFITGPEVWN